MAVFLNRLMDKLFFGFLILLLAALPLLNGCGGGGSGGGSSGSVDPSRTTPVDLDDQISIQSGLKDGGASQQASQVMSGTVPNPAGASSTRFDGKAYLVLNGVRNQLSVSNSAVSENSGETIYKDGKEYFLDDADQKNADGIAPKGDPKASPAWTFTFTFSINAGSNSISVEVYDLNDTLFASTSQWTVIGAIEPSSLTVALNDPDLSSYPIVKVTVTVTDPSNSTEPRVTGLAASNFYVINAGKSMSSVSLLSAVENVYTLTYTDIAAGKRDLYVYVCVPAQGDSPKKGGLCATKTYGTNFAVLAGLNEYPASNMSSGFDWISGTPDYVQVTVDSTRIPDGAGDFTFTFTDTKGVRSAVSVIPNEITPPPATNITSYRLDFDKPENYADYDRITVSYKKLNWLTWCVKDTTDLKDALLAKGTGMSNTSWESGNITSYTNSAATKDNILGSIEAIANSMQKYDLLLFQFSGHGSGQPEAGNANQYLCAYQNYAWISVNDLKEKLELVPKPTGGIANVFIFMDSCHSGNFIGKNLLARGDDVQGQGSEKILKYRPFMPQAETAVSSPGMNSFRDLTALSNIFVMAAQTGRSYSWDDGTLKNGVFTYYLVEGINVSGKRVSAALANSNNDVWVTGEEAFSYLEPKTRAWVSVANGYSEGDFQYPQVQDNSTTLSALLIYNW